MSPQEQNASLSLPARLVCYLGPPAVALLTCIISPLTALFSPLAFLSTTYLYRKWRASNETNPSRRAPLESLLWTYTCVGSIGLAAVLLAQTAISSATLTLLFPFSSSAKEDFRNEFSRSSSEDLSPSELAHRTALAGSWRNWVFNAVFAYIIAALVEETLKYLPIIYARRRRGSSATASAPYLDYALAGALSFGVVETIGFLAAAAAAGSHHSWLRFALTILERVVAGALGHLLTAVLTALRAARYQSSWWRTIGPSVLLHGTWNFVAMAASAREGNVGWVHPTGVGNTVGMLSGVVGLLGVAALLVRGEWLALRQGEEKEK
ncbi:MAG: hypothetical protein LQ346_008172 [Caloplaca aetnensis]|nr:MAG: hypothetical protein LQ346_008172 [Caloplaca aetnensis]